MTLLAYRPLARGRATGDADRDAGDAERAAGDDNPGPLDWALAALALVALVYPLLVLEATRRTVGWVVPAICLAFVAYAMLGSLLPFGWELGHKGYDLERLVGQTYMGIEGLFGVPLDVAATYIVLFTIYGAVLEFSGAGRFFIDVGFAAFGTRSAAAPGRTATLAGFLLGTVSGSGVATTVTLGSVAWPVLRRAGYPPNPGGGVLSAAGIAAPGSQALLRRAGQDVSTAGPAAPPCWWRCRSGWWRCSWPGSPGSDGTAWRWSWPTSAAAGWPASPCLPRAGSPSSTSTRSTGPR
jgi:hypothetical protein